MKNVGFPFFFIAIFFFNPKSVCLLQTVQHFSNDKRGFVASQVHPRKNKPLEIKAVIHHHGFRSPFFYLHVFLGDSLSSSCTRFINLCTRFINSRSRLISLCTSTS